MQIGRVAHGGQSRQGKSIRWPVADCNGIKEVFNRISSQSAVADVNDSAPILLAFDGSSGAIGTFSSLDCPHPSGGSPLRQSQQLCNRKGHAVLQESIKTTNMLTRREIVRRTGVTLNLQTKYSNLLMNNKENNTEPNRDSTTWFSNIISAAKRVFWHQRTTYISTTGREVEHCTAHYRVFY